MTGICVWKYCPRIISEKFEAPVLDKIMICESEGNHLDKNGQVKMNVNTDKTIDIGIFQINLTIWGATAGTMGLDLSKESDNKQFALWLYKNYGTEFWSNSSKCWSK